MLLKITPQKKHFAGKKKKKKKKKKFFLDGVEITLHSSLNLRKRTFGHVLLAKIQISLRIGEVWSESSLSAFWIAKDAKFLHADNEKSHQTVRRRRIHHENMPI